MNNIEQENEILRELLVDIIMYSNSYICWAEHYNIMKKERQAFFFMKEKIKNAETYLNTEKL